MEQPDRPVRLVRLNTVESIGLLQFVSTDPQEAIRIQNYPVPHCHVGVVPCYTLSQKRCPRIGHVKEH